MDRNYVVRFGNHWLQSDDNLAVAEWVADLALATRHTKEWVERFAADLRSLGKRVEVFPFDEALAMMQRQTAEAVKKRWLYKFEAAVHRTYGRKNVNKDGVWANAHMFYGQGLTVEVAVRRFGESLRLTPLAVS